MTTTTAEPTASDDLAAVQARLAAAEERITKYEERLNGKPGIDPAGERARARQAEQRQQRLKSGSLPEGTVEPDDIDGVAVAETIIRRNSGW